MPDEILAVTLNTDENLDVSFYTDAQMTADLGDVSRVSENVRTDYNQTDPDAKDYLIGRENIVGRAELDTVTEEILAKAKASGEFDGADGEDGKTPVKGVDYFDGEDGYTPVKGVDYFDGEDGYTPVKGVDYFDGKDGQSGKDGSDGTPCTHRWSGTTLYVTSASGTSYANLKGEKGDTGASGISGQDGYTPVKGVDYFDGKDGVNGKDGRDGYTPIKGEDYFTAADKAEMVSAVIASLPVYNGEVVTA